MRAFVTLLFVSVFFVRLAIAQAPEISSQVSVLNGIAAVVNGDVITFSEVRDLVAPREKALRQQFQGEELAAKIKEVRTAALQDLIDRRLIIQYFNKEGYSIPDEIIEQGIREIVRESFNGDRETFVKTLQAQNYTLGEFKKLERDKVIVQAMRAKNTKINTIVPPNKITAYYKSHRDEFADKQRVKLRMIMIQGADSSGNPAQKSLAEEILSKLNKGADFERMAQMYSEDSTREIGGDWGWVEKGTLSEDLEKVAFSLPTGKISGIISLSGNYYIIKVEEKEGGVLKPLAEVRAAIEKKLRQEEVQRVQERWLVSLRQKAYIKTF